MKVVGPQSNSSGIGAIIEGVSWAITIVGVAIGLLILFGGMATAQSAPQESVVVALAVACAVLPYLFRSSDPPSEEFMKILFVILILATSTLAQVDRETKIAQKPKDEQYKTNYDKFKDLTTIQSPRFTTNRLDKPKTDLGTGVTLVLTYPGQTVSDKAEFWMVLFSTGKRDWQWTGLKNVIVLADGKRYDLRVYDRDVDVNSSRSYGRYGTSRVSLNEELYMTVPAETLRAMLAASRVEVQAGPIEFALHDASITVFKNMLSLTEKNPS